MYRLLAITLFLAACPSDDYDGMPPAATMPDAAMATPMPDAPKPPPPPLKGYGELCSGPSDCATGLCIGVSGGQYRCSRTCSINDPNPCKDVDAFCAPYQAGGHVCYGQIETGNDLDDAILVVGDSATRSLSPLTDADLFQVRLNQLGEIRITATPSTSIDVKLEIYNRIGDGLGIQNTGGPSIAEQMYTDVQQIEDNYVFAVVRNVGTTTGSYTIAITKTP
jgi:hypothetical protein